MAVYAIFIIYMFFFESPSVLCRKYGFDPNPRCHCRVLSPTRTTQRGERTSGHEEYNAEGDKRERRILVKVRR